jgi:hypothetical protein
VLEALELDRGSGLGLGATLPHQTISIYVPRSTVSLGNPSTMLNSSTMRTEEIGGGETRRCVGSWVSDGSLDGSAGRRCQWPIPPSTALASIDRASHGGVVWDL